MLHPRYLYVYMHASYIFSRMNVCICVCVCVQRSLCRTGIAGPLQPHIERHREKQLRQLPQEGLHHETSE